MPPTISSEQRSFAITLLSLVPKDFAGTTKEPITAFAQAIANRDSEIFAQLNSDLAEQAKLLDAQFGDFSFEALNLAAKERVRQVTQERFSLTHDDSHVGGELALAAACYAIPPWFRFEFGGIFNLWPWAREQWKPSTSKPEGARRDIVKAIALLVAEDQRLEREQLRNAPRELGVPPALGAPYGEAPKLGQGDFAEDLAPSLIAGCPLKDGPNTVYRYRAPTLTLEELLPHTAGGLWAGARVIEVLRPLDLRSEGYCEGVVIVATPVK